MLVGVWIDRMETYEGEGDDSLETSRHGCGGALVRERGREEREIEREESRVGRVE